MISRPSIRAGRWLALVPSIALLLVATLTLAAGAEDADPAPESAGEVRAEAPDPAAVTDAVPEVTDSVVPDGGGLSALDRALAQVLESERTELARLQRAYEAAPDAQTALAVQRAIDALKQRSELQILEIQLVHFRAEGHAAAVAELEPVVEQMRAALADLPSVELTPAPGSGTEE